MFSSLLIMTCGFNSVEHKLEPWYVLLNCKYCGLKSELLFVKEKTISWNFCIPLHHIQHLNPRIGISWHQWPSKVWVGNTCLMKVNFFVFELVTQSQ